MKQGRRAETFIFASLMDICNLKNAESEKHQKYKGRVVLRGDIVKDDSGSYAVFTEQGSSASQMTAAKVMDIIPRLPRCSGQTADAVSAYTQVKVEDARKLLNISKIGMSRHLDSSNTTQMAKIMVQYGRPSRSAWAKSVWSSFGRTVMGKAIWENHIEIRLGENPIWEWLFVHREKGLFLSVYVDDTKLAGKKQNLDLMWKVQKKEVDLGEPASFFDHAYLGCTQRQCEINKNIVWQLQNHVRIQNFCRNNRKITMLGKSEYLFVVLWHGR